MNLLSFFQEGKSYPAIKPGAYTVQVTKFTPVSQASKVEGAAATEFIRIDFDVIFTSGTKVPAMYNLFEAGFKIFLSNLRQQFETPEDAVVSVQDLCDLALCTQVAAWYQEVPKEGSNQPYKNWLFYDPTTQETTLPQESENETVPAPQNASEDKATTTPTKRNKAKREKLPF